MYEKNMFFYELIFEQRSCLEQSSHPFVSMQL